MPHPDSLAAMIGPEATVAAVLAGGIATFCVMMFSPYGRDRRRGDTMVAAAREANRRRGSRR